MLFLESNHIARVIALRIDIAIDLLAARVSYLRRAEFRGFPHFAASFDLDELIKNAQRRRVGRSRERSAHSKCIHAGSGIQQRGNSFFIEIAGHENLHVAPARFVQLLAHPDAVGGQIAAIQPHTARFASDRDDLFEGGAYVVRIQQQHRMMRENIHEPSKGFFFAVMGHDPGMGLRAVGGNARIIDRREHSRFPCTRRYRPREQPARRIRCRERGACRTPRRAARPRLWLSRAAFEAIMVWKLIVASSAVSTICASAIGAVMRRRGSPGKQTVPSGMRPNVAGEPKCRQDTRRNSR